MVDVMNISSQKSISCANTRSLSPFLLLSGACFGPWINCRVDGDDDAQYHVNELL